MPTAVKIFFFLLFTAAFTAHFEEPWGKDSDFTCFKSEKPKELSLIGKIADSIITFHQKVLSPVDGPRSHFRPSSSRYMQLAIERYGFLKGYLMGCD
ncbi:MAG: membrane protein insertion efficiency factor YidD, partial [Parachlamydiales bacterium]